MQRIVAGTALCLYLHRVSRMRRVARTHSQSVRRYLVTDGACSTWLFTVLFVFLSERSGCTTLCEVFVPGQSFYRPCSLQRNPQIRFQSAPETNQVQANRFLHVFDPPLRHPEAFAIQNWTGSCTVFTACCFARLPYRRAAAVWC